METNGREYSGKPSSFDAAVCLGASWIWGGLELLANVRRARSRYLQWGREEIGWAVYLFAKDPVRLNASSISSA